MYIKFTCKFLFLKKFVYHHDFFLFCHTFYYRQNELLLIFLVNLLQCHQNQ